VSEFRRTKIVATLGPSSEKPEVLDKLIAAGVNVVRLNFSHGTAEEHMARAELVRATARKHGVFVGILADMQGPKIRTGKFKTGKTMLVPGNNFTLDAAMPLADGDDERVGITYKELVGDVEPGAILLLNDGLLELLVDDVVGQEIRCTVLIGGELSNNKGINRKGGGLSAAALTDKDKEDIKTAVKLNADYIAISFPRNGGDIAYARSLMQAAGGSAGIVAKVERAEAVEDENLKSILHESDAVMVARGDLGVEIGDAAVPPVQKKILRLAPKYNCPVIVATQMMESMITNPVPTRAEVNDVANAVLDGTDAVMLSGESAAGKYPLEAVLAMHRTCLATEKQNVLPSSETRKPREPESIDESMACAAIELARLDALKVKACVAFTQSGNSARYMSRHLVPVPIYALSPIEATLGRATLYRSVVPRFLHPDHTNSARVACAEAERILLADGMVQLKDSVVMTLGTPMGKSGATNTVKVEVIGDLANA